MKNLVILGLVVVMLAPVLVVGCSGTANVPKEQTIAVTLDEFASSATMAKQVEIAKDGTLNVRLGSNPSTGYSWDDAEISDATVIEQLSRNYEEPTTNALGAPGTEVWVFHAIDTGLAIIKISYGRPWESEKLYNLTININVR